VEKVVVAPGNSGFDRNWERWPVNLSDGTPAYLELAKKARMAGITLAVIGPDLPLAFGIVDVFEGFGIRCFGPSKAAAQIEASKSFAKEVMAAAKVPTAQFEIAHSVEQGLSILRTQKWAESGAVIKADGLALGKGVRVCDTPELALQAVRDLLPLSGKVLIEEKLEGEEISWLAFCDGRNCSLLEPAKDHKRLLDDDQGPNTGGMGAYSPVQGFEGLRNAVREQVFLPVLEEMERRETPFRGVLYAGLMVAPARDRFWVLEFNARFGDPEAQVLLPRLEGDFYDWCEAVAHGDLGKRSKHVQFKKETTVVVIGASQGYPELPESGRLIPFSLAGEPLDPQHPGYFWAGVAAHEDRLVSAGGRVLGAMGYGHDLGEARREAYDRLKVVKFEGMLSRGDIGRAEMARLE
jgi:phosphoribosylamine--glycine ligase